MTPKSKHRRRRHTSLSRQTLSFIHWQGESSKNLDRFYVALPVTGANPKVRCRLVSGGSSRQPHLDVVDCILRFLFGYWPVLSRVQTVPTGPRISKKTEIETPYLLLIFKGPLPIAYPRRYLVYSDRTVVSTEYFRISSLTELPFERLRSVLPRPQGKVKVFSIDWISGVKDLFVSAMFQFLSLYLIYSSFDKY